jgi:glycosyltransferase involved in cell wall biosynthesis
MINSKPKISIVTVCLNSIDYIEETIKSILNQNYPNLEYIIIDGGSTDGTFEVVERYKSQLKYFISEKDLGHANALNKGFKKSTGEIMGFLNADDIYMPWTFKTISGIFLNFKDVNWITGIQSFINDKSENVGSGVVLKNIQDFLNNNYQWIQQESTFWKRSLWEKAGGYINEEYKFSIDTDLWTRFFLHERLYHLNSIIASFRDHSKCRSNNNHDAMKKEENLIIKKLKNKYNQNYNVSDDYPRIIYDTNEYSWKKFLTKKI